MYFGRPIKFESLEDRRLLAVTASVTAGGDLLVQGTADGAVEIVAVSQGAFRVTDNGVVIADSDTLTGVTDDIKINLADGAAATDVVSVDLGGTTVDEVYAKLGGGDNSFTLTNGTAGSLNYRGGAGADAVSLAATIDGASDVNLGAGDNSLTVTGALGRLSVKGGAGADGVTIDAAATINGSVKLALGSGDNTADIGGTIDGSLAYDGRAGNDVVTIAETASITDDFFARLGEGDNAVTHNGSVGGDFKVVSANAEDSVNIADTATVGGETTLGLGEQTEGHGGHGGHGGGCGHRGSTDDDSTGTTTSTQASVVQSIMRQVPGLQAALNRAFAASSAGSLRR